MYHTHPVKHPNPHELLLRHFSSTYSNKGYLPNNDSPLYVVK